VPALEKGLQARRRKFGRPHKNYSQAFSVHAPKLTPPPPLFIPFFAVIIYVS
jgi:hypothetical protein